MTTNMIQNVNNILFIFVRIFIAVIFYFVIWNVSAGSESTLKGVIAENLFKSEPADSLAGEK